jgi:curved DNA-binding protein CbpA
MELIITAAGKAHLTYDEALQAMGVSGKESADELKRIFRDKMRKMHPDLPENRGQDTVQKALDLNAAYDILRGEAKPAAYDFRGPFKEPPARRQEAPPPGAGSDGDVGGGQRTNWKPPEPVTRTFEQARTTGGVPTSGIDWKFVTAVQRDKGSYQGDESSFSKRAWVAYGLYKDQHFFAVASHFERHDYFIGGNADVDMWWVEFRMFPVKRDEGNDPAWLTRQVIETFKVPKGEYAVGSRFNSKVIDAQGWKFGEKLPVGRELSIKNWLVNLGGVATDAPAVAGRKQTVELECSSERFYDKAPKPGYYPQPKRGPNDYNYNEAGKYTGDYWQFTLVLNGKPITLGEADTVKILNAKLGGKRLVNAIFGEYIYGGGKKVLTRLAKGKVILKWMADSLTDLPPDARAILAAAEAQLKGR